jgi:16S rRNA C967 or C1407 C5-methylase (RsmB/RsmF family)
MMQNVPSAVVAHALDPQPGEVIIDLCSAPGGKASHVASIVRNKAIVIACDKSRKKMVATRKFFDEMGATCIIPLAWDSTACVVQDGSAYRSVHEVSHAA